MPQEKQKNRSSRGGQTCAPTNPASSWHIGWHLWLLTLMLLLAPGAHADLHEMDDSSLSTETGQALFTMDKISGASDAIDAAANITFYRISLDTQLGFNLNINQLQLGCGGINQGIITGCDIDLSDVRFMGTGSGQTVNGITQADAGSAVTSDFVLTRPYLELAVTNDSTPTQRELAGIAIGAESANGYLSIGSFNASNSSSCNSNPGQTSCHTGINSFSGYMQVTVQSATLTGGCITVFGICVANYTATATNQTVTIDGTRITAPVLPLTATATADGLNITLNTLLQDPLTFIHNLEFNNTSNFFLSFERQQIDYPNFDGKTFAATANTGWWMNAPSGVTIPTFTSNDAPNISASTALSGAVGANVLLQNVDLASRPVSNCYGVSTFC